MSTILKCSFEESWNNKPIVYCAIKELWASVPVAPQFRGKPFYDRVKDDIVKNGLHFPILVVDTTFKELEQQKIRHKKAMNDLPTGYNPDDRILVVWGGSNRLAIAHELGYTHIAAVMYTNFDEAFRDQNLHRAPFQTFYTGGRPLPGANVPQLR